MQSRAQQWAARRFLGARGRTTPTMSQLLSVVAALANIAAQQHTVLPAKIVVACNATKTELWAAGKLADMLALPVVVGALEGAQIAVGHGAAVALGADPENLATLGDDAYVVSASRVRGVPPGSAMIASSAGSARGTMNGAFAFLRALGFDFFAQDETTTPATRPALVSTLDVLFEPPMESRDMAAVPVAGPGGQRAKPPPYPPGQGLMTLPTNLSAALGFNGGMAYAPVGGQMGPFAVPGYTASVYNLLSPSGSTFACGFGAVNATQKWLPCPAAYARNPDWFACMDHNKNAFSYGNHV